MEKGDDGFQIEAQPNISKAKVTFALPAFYVRGFVNLCFSDASSDGLSGFNASAECRDILGLPFPAAYQNPDHALGGAGFSAFVVSSPGPSPTYGAFPPVTVHALAFGSVPVSATVQLSQAQRGGYVTPLDTKFAYIDSPFDVGAPTYPGLPPTVPRPTNPDGSMPTYLVIYRSSIDGLIDVHLSNISVDGHPLNVSPQCGTTRSAHLKVRNALGFFFGSADNSSTPGTPGDFSPQSQSGPGSTFQGTVDIPSFSNCTTPDGQDLSRLLTSFISSPVNRLSGHLFPGAADPRASWCSTPVAHCPPTVAAQQAKTFAIAKKLLAHHSPADLRKLAKEVPPALRAGSQKVRASH